MIEDIRFSDSNKKVYISIDNETQNIPLYQVDKLQTFFKLEQLMDTPLRENIDVDALLYYIPYDKGIDDANVVNIDGTVLITIYNEKDIYYQNNVLFKKGHIQDSITNKLPLGEYKATLEFAGNQYFEHTLLTILFRVEKRPTTFIFSADDYSGYPDETIQVSGQLKDIITNKPVKNCNINYTFNSETYATATNSNGGILIHITVPDVDIMHCTMEDDYPNPSYPLFLYLDSDAYILNGANSNITAIKLPTEVTINQSSTITNNIVTLTGNAIAKYKNENRNVKYGSVRVTFEDTDYVSPPTSVTEQGNFSLDINFADINEFNNESSLNAPIIYQKANEQITSTHLTVESESIRVGDMITGIAHVFSEESSDYVKNGMVVFILTNSKEKELYRYATQIDSIGQAVFLFNTSTKDTYHVKAYYYGIFGFLDSESEIIEVEVK